MGTQRQTKRSTRGLNAYLRDIVGDSQEQRGYELGKGERTIRLWDQQDRDREAEPWEDWFPNHLGDAQEVINQHVAVLRIKAMYPVQVPEALDRWRPYPYAEKVLGGIRDRENRFAALEGKIAEAVTRGNSKDARDLIDELESVLLEWITA